MSFNTNRLTKRAFGIFSILSAFSFTMFYFNNYLLFDELLVELSKSYDALEYLRFALTEIIDFLFPTVTAILIFPRLTCDKAYRAYPMALIICASRLFYNIPYNYLYYLLAYRYDSIESISISIPLSALYTALHALYAVLLAYIAKLIFVGAGGDSATLTEKAPILSDKKPHGKAILSVILIHFAIRAVKEIIEVVAFLTEYADTLRMGELIYITLAFVYIVTVMLLSGVVCASVYNKYVRGRITLE